MKNIAIIGAMVLFLSGCATRDEVDAAKAEALAAAAVAQTTADRAQQCCDATTTRLERMYQKIMSK